MRLSGFRGAPTQSNGRKNFERGEAAQAVEQTTSPQPVDEEIESLLLSLEEKHEPVRVDAYSAPRAGRDLRERRSVRRRRHRSERVHQFDLVFVVTAVVLGFGVGLLTVFFVNG